MKKDSSYYWDRVNGLRFAISKLDSVCKSFRVPGSEGSLRSIMASSLLHDALCGSFTQALEMFRPHTDDMTKLEAMFVSTAKQAIKEVFAASLSEDVISWSEVTGEKVYNPYGVKEGEEDE